MADKEEKQTGTDPGAPLTLGELGKFITDKVTEAVTAVKGVTDSAHEKSGEVVETKLDRKSSIAEQVQAELAKLRDQEKKEGESKGLTDRIAALESLTAEKAPVERRRVHRFMGWGD